MPQPFAQGKIFQLAFDTPPHPWIVQDPGYSVAG